MLKEVTKYFLILLLTLIIILLLLLVMKGRRGDPIYYQNPDSSNKQVGGPFESSGTTSRYALTEAIVENNTLFFTEEQARFSAPDFVQYNDRFFSIFTPGVSFLAIPFFIVGKQFGLPQIGAFSLNLLVSVINVLLVSKIVNKLGGSLIISLLTGFIFLFATNALSYSLTLTQHPLSAMVILLALLNIFSERTLLKNILLGIIAGIGFLVDIPILIVISPVLLYVLYKHFNIKKLESNKYKVNVRFVFLGLIIGLLPLIILYGWYNYQLTGSYTKIGQRIGRSEYFQPEAYKEKLRLERESGGVVKKSLPFKTRNQIYNLYILLISNERGLLIFCPIVFVGVLGFLLLSRQKDYKDYSFVYISVILTNIVVYSLFGAYGGWSFGPRYLIPGVAVMVIGTGLALDKYKKKIWFIPFFLLLTGYSIGVNVLGTMTTTQVPPKVEAINLPSPIPYTYEYNWQLMTKKNLNSSLVYNLYLKDKISSLDYALIYTSCVFGIVLLLYVLSLKEKNVSNQL